VDRPVVQISHAIMELPADGPGIVMPEARQPDARPGAWSRAASCVPWPV